MTRTTSDIDAERYWSRIVPTLTRVPEWPTGGTGTGRCRLIRRLADESGRIRAVTRDDPVLLHVLATAALSVTLAACHGRSTVVIGVPGLTEPVVLPVAIAVPPDAGGRAHLGAVREKILEAYAAQGFDPARLVESDVGGQYPLAGWLVRHPALHAAMPGAFDGIVEVTDGLLTFDLDAGLLGAEYLADRVVEVLVALAADPHAALRTLRKPCGSVARGAELPAAVDVLTELEDAGGPAVVAEDGTLTYADLLARSAAVGRGLLVLARDGVVALCTGQTGATVVAALAALRAGVPYVVVPPHVVADDALLASRGVTVKVVLSARGQGITERTLEELSEVGGPRDFPEVSPDSPAYHVYTSGTTGAAKAVIVTRANLAASNSARHLVYGSGPEQFLLLSPFHFDSSVAGLYGTLTTGGTLHIVPERMLGDPAALAEYANRHGITATLGLPRVLEGVLRAATELPSLHRIIAAGETFPTELARLAASAGVRVTNEYGPSEATVWITSHDVPADLTDATDVPIGRPVPGSHVYVLDGWGDPVPPGVPGELAIGGPQVSAGYLGAPERTAKQFGPDPLDGAARMYRTGDLGWVEPDGTLYFLGRADDEVKVRGARVALPDVAATLRSRDELRDAEVLLHRGELVAIGVGRGGVGPAEILDRLCDRLVGPALPSRLVLVPAIPRLANGKADPAGLARIVDEQAVRTRRTPGDNLERHLAELFGRTLDTPPAGVDDNFFASGGDSIKAALLTSHLSLELSTYVYLVALLDHPTPASLAAFLRAEYPDAVAGLLSTAATEATAGTESTATGEAAEVLRRLVAVENPLVEARSVPRMAFVLAPPRSGTTLLRIMLAGHPGVFAPPELELLQFGTLADRRLALSGRHAFYQEGMVRAVMSVCGWDADVAGEWLDRAAGSGWTVPDLYAWLVESAAGRMVVDKTAAYALDLGALRNAEQWCDQPRYIHLTRDPRACVRSFLQARLDQVYLRAEHPFEPRQLAELVWRVAHENIGAFLDGVPSERVLRVAFEELVAEPEQVARRMCAFLDLPFDAAMLDVHGDHKVRMSDGVRPGGRMLGDVKFHEYNGIDAQVADRWRDPDAAALHPRTVAVGRELGYPRDGLRRDGPLLATQRWLALMDLLRPGTVANIIPVALTGHGRVDLEALRRAVRTVVRRHHPLRSLTVVSDGEPVSRFEPDLPVPVVVEEVPAGRHPARVRELASVPFDLATQSPLRVHVLLDGDDFTLLLVIHHIVADPASLRLVVGDLLTAYDGWRSGRVPTLPAVPRQAVDAAVEESGRTPPTERMRARLAGARWSLNLPPVHADVPEPPAVVLTVDAATTAGLRAYAASRDCSTYRALLAVFGWTVHGWTGDDDFCVATPVVNRGPADRETVGLFVTTGVVRIAVAGSASYDELVRKTEQPVRDAIADVDVPYEEIVMAPAGQAGDGALLSAYFALNRVDLPLDICPDLGLRRMPLPPREAKFDVDLAVLDHGDELVVRAGLTARRFDAGAGRRFAEDFVVQVRQLIANPVSAPIPVTRPGDAG